MSGMPRRRPPRCSPGFRWATPAAAETGREVGGAGGGGRRSCPSRPARVTLGPGVPSCWIFNPPFLGRSKLIDIVDSVNLDSVSKKINNR
jgi:hypothetical protein